MAIEFGDALTYHLARVGFDSEYKLTDDGRILEDLIDRFFPDQVPNSRC